ncbi:hypothetical protein PoB_004046200 [Plakobranchus ocellatus]|uniref:Uncharacterized protein n=1 Tax=Plakobranchus ocellatus TaxID=259542 RepID=A0AAV4B372_9GAST|nr:hypothetical protein PoB_004046200 [Plakobranchus ocellatus]
MTNRLGSVGQHCPPVLEEVNSQGGVLTRDNHYCWTVTTSTPRKHASPHTVRTSRQVRRPQCGVGHFDYFQHQKKSRQDDST